MKRLTDHGKGFQQDEGLVEIRAAVGIPETGHALIAAAVEIDESIVFIVDQFARVFRERPDAFDVPAFDAAPLSFVSLWFGADGGGDAEFFSAALGR